MIPRRWAPFLAVSLLLAGCATTEEKARNELEKLGIAYSEDEFFDSIIAGKAEIVGLFLQAGMSPNAKKGEITALMEAARRGKIHAGIAAALVKAGAEVNAKDSYGVTPLLYAAISGSAETIRTLLQSGADVKARDVDGRTVLVEALTTENDLPLEVIEEIIKAGADVNVRVYGGLTPLMIAAGGNSRVLKALIEAGAELDATDDRGETALMRAKGTPDNYRMLKDAGAKE